MPASTSRKRRSAPSTPVDTPAKRRASAAAADPPTDVAVTPPATAGEWCRALQSGRDAEEFIDITLLVEDRRIPAHKIVLAGFSPYIHGLLTSGLAESKEGGHELRIGGADGGAVAAIVDCFYCGTLSISRACASSIIRTANMLGVDAVEKAACDFFVESLDPASACEAFDFAAAHEACGEHARGLHERCARYVVEHFVECSAEPSFLELPRDAVAKVIGSDDLPADEEAVLAAVRAWFNHDVGGRQGSLQTLLPLVRWPLLPVDAQLRLSKEPLLKRLMRLDDDTAQTLGMDLLLECSAGYAQSEAAAVCVRLKRRKGTRARVSPTVFTAFSRAHYTTREDGALLIGAPEDEDEDVDLRAALCSETVMSSGQSCAEFTIVRDAGLELMIGVARPTLDTSQPSAYTGEGFWGILNHGGEIFNSSEIGSDWQGRPEGGYVEGDVLRLLLDSDAGTLTVKNNGVLLGVAVTDGLTGDLCWAAALDSDDSGAGSVRIKAVDPAEF